VVSSLSAGLDLLKWKLLLFLIMFLLHGPSFSNVIKNFFSREGQSHDQQPVLKIWKYQQMSGSKEIEKIVDEQVVFRPALRCTTAM